MTLPSEADVPEPSSDTEETALHDADEFHFPVLASVLSTYFTKDHKDVLFYEEYAEYGEDNIRFKGLKQDLEDAVKSPNKAAKDVNKALGIEDGTLTPSQVRDELIDVYDKITSSGRFSEEAILQAQAEDAERIVNDPERMMNAYAGRPVVTPAWLGPLGGYSIPVWVFAAAGALLMLGGVGLRAIGTPFTDWVAAAFSLIGILAFAFGTFSMVFLNRAIRSADKEARQAAEEAANAKKGVVVKTRSILPWR